MIKTKHNDQGLSPHSFRDVLKLLVEDCKKKLCRSRVLKEVCHINIKVI
jgi:hypothetical protein